MVWLKPCHPFGSNSVVRTVQNTQRMQEREDGRNYGLGWKDTMLCHENHEVRSSDSTTCRERTEDAPANNV